MTQNEIKYIVTGDYYVPNLSMKTYHRLGKWGQIYKRYLKESRPIQYQVLLVNDKLWDELEAFDKRAQVQEQQIVEHLKKQEGIDEQLKERDPLRWAGLMNNIQNCAEEIVREEMMNL